MTWKVYSEIVPFDISYEALVARHPAAIILSGGPASVYAPGAPEVDKRIFEMGIPVLGFCYGMQVMAAELGGTVPQTDIGEYGPAVLSRQGASLLLEGTPEEQVVWMSHRDSREVPFPDGFTITSSTPTTPVASMEDAARKLYATQFHPEVAHNRIRHAHSAEFPFRYRRAQRRMDDG